MVRQSPDVPSVLIVEGDPSHRRLIATVLQHAEFQVSTVADAAAATDLLQRFQYHAVVRDLNLAPGHRDQALQQLLSTSPELLRRTVITTTAAARARKMIGPNRVFAIVGKPFDVQELVDAVSRCARGSRDDAVPSGATGSVRKQALHDGGGESAVKLETVRRFVGTVPSLEHLLSLPVASEGEAMLRAEMRRTVGAISTLLDQAAKSDASGTRATVLRAASRAAARMASPPARAHERDH